MSESECNYALSWRLIVSARDRGDALSTYRGLARLAELPDDPEQVAPYEKLRGTWEATVYQPVESIVARDILALAMDRMHRLGTGWLTSECEFGDESGLRAFGAIFDARQFSRPARPKLIWGSLDILPFRPAAPAARLVQLD